MSIQKISIFLTGGLDFAIVGLHAENRPKGKTDAFFELNFTGIQV